MRTPDHYATLGVLPEAEAVVIKAAYRALAQRYHPDKWSGDPAEAHRRTAAINEAYRVLADDALRTEYDAARKANGHADYQSAERDEHEEAFGAALEDLEDRWSLAVDIFPDLASTRKALARTSASLSFSFVTVLLESKEYSRRQQIAAALEQRFLERYFGTSPSIVAYAKELIADGRRDAARVLNRLVETMGSAVRPDLLIQRVEKQFGVRAGRASKHEVIELSRRVRDYGFYEDAQRLAEQLGFTIRRHYRGLSRKEVDISVASADGTPRQFSSTLQFVAWVQAELCVQ